MRVERFLANAQLLRQIIHGDTAESVTEKVHPRSIDNSLPVGIVLSASWRQFVCPLHIHRSLITKGKLVQYIRFPRVDSGRHARRAPQPVLLTMVAPEKDLEGYRPIFEAVSESLELGE